MSLRTWVILNIGVLAAAFSAAADNCEQSTAAKIHGISYISVQPGPGGRFSKLTQDYLRDLKPGGVLVHPVPDPSGNFAVTLPGMRETVRQIREAYPEASGGSLPFIGVDYLTLRNGARGARGKESALGFGTRSGTLFDPMKPVGGALFQVCAQLVTEIQAFAHRILGINHPLGPIVDQELSAKNPRPAANPERVREMLRGFSAQNMIPTLKHYPYTVRGLELHRYSASLNLSEAQIRELEKNFFLEPAQTIVMTTHMGARGIDGGEIATFSPAWGERLRQGIGEDSLMMTDGLFMIGGYQEKLQQLAGLTAQEFETYTKAGEVEPWKYAFGGEFVSAKCLEYAEPWIEGYRGKNLRGKYEEIEKILCKRFDCDSPNADAEIFRKSGCSQAELYDLFDLQDGKLGFGTARELSIRMVERFAEKAILSGHDLILLEGHPQINRKMAQSLAQKACSADGQALRARIDQAAERVRKFKDRHRTHLSQRSSARWMEDNADLIDKLLFKIYPALVQKRSRCRGIEEARTLLDRLTGTFECE